MLVLSVFAGASYELKQALIVNPHDLDGVADAIATASNMSLPERLERWHCMLQQLQENDIGIWRARYLQALEAT